jgi:hypothetical protein
MCHMAYSNECEKKMEVFHGWFCYDNAYKQQSATYSAETYTGRYCSIPYLLTPWSRVLPEKLKCPELLEKFPAFYGT